MCSYKSALVVCLLVFASNAKNNTTDVIGFPEMEENPDLKNKDDRLPMFLPALCPYNELYYPGDQKDDWICDCRPSFIYHPPSDNCWPSYMRGPCATGEYLILPQNSVIPVCVKNPCNVDGFVVWNSKCEKLGTTGPCNSSFPLISVLGVNATTLVVSCVRVTSDGSRFGVMSVNGECPSGSKRSYGGQCVPIS